MICLRVKMWSLHDFFLRKPAFSSRISLSRVAEKSSSLTLLNFLLVRLKGVKPLQLLESNRFPFSKSFTIRSVFQSSSMFSDIQISQKNFARMVNVRDFSGSTRSALIPSAPGAIPLFILLIIDFVNRRRITVYVDVLCGCTEWRCSLRFWSCEDTVEIPLPSSKLSPTQNKTLPFSFFTGLFSLM